MNLVPEVAGTRRYRWLLLAILLAGCAPHERAPQTSRRYQAETGMREILVPGNAWLYARPQETAHHVRIVAEDEVEDAGFYRFVVIEDRGEWLEVIASMGSAEGTGPLHDWGLRLFVHRQDESRVLDPTRRPIGGGSRTVYWPDGSLAGRASGTTLSAWGAVQPRGVLRCGDLLLGGPGGRGPAEQRTLTVCLQNVD